MYKTQPQSTLTGWHLTALRVGWIVLALLTICVLMAAIQPRHRLLFTIAPGNLQLTGLGELRESEVVQLQSLGLGVAFYANFFTLIETIQTPAYILVSALVFWRGGSHRQSLFFGIVLLPTGLIGNPMIDTLIILESQWATWALLLKSIGFICFAAVLFTFPDGRFRPRWTFWLFSLCALWAAMWLLFPSSFFYLSLTLAPESPQQRLAILIAILLIGSGMILQFHRYRRLSNVMQRHQTKWVIFSLVTTVTLLLFTALPILFVPDIQRSLLYRMITFTIVLSGSILFAFSIALAVMRYRLYDTDLIIRRTLIYSILTAALAALYFGGVVLAQTVLRPLTASSDLAIVLSTLGIAALFNPLRHRIQNTIDRRFFRRKYNAERTLAAFSLAVRDEVDLDKLQAALVGVVQETLQPQKIGLWLRESENSFKPDRAP